PVLHAQHHDVVDAGGARGGQVGVDGRGGAGTGTDEWTEGGGAGYRGAAEQELTSSRHAGNPSGAGDPGKQMWKKFRVPFSAAPLTLASSALGRVRGQRLGQIGGHI